MAYIDFGDQPIDVEKALIQRESAVNRILEHGFTEVNREDVDLSYIIEDAVKDNEFIAIELANMIARLSNQENSTIKELLRPYVEVAVDKAMAE
jgi:hypothetical protein